MSPFGWVISSTLIGAFFAGTLLILHLVAWSMPGRGLRVLTVLLTPAIIGLAIGLPIFIDNQLDRDRKCQDAGGVPINSQCFQRQAVVPVP